MEVASHFVKKGTPCIITLLDCTKAFDKCKFDILFQKLAERNLSPILIRVLIFVYEEQKAWVKWGKARSRSFGIVNGTRQGSVLSPALFSVYMDKLIMRLRRSGVGCHLGEVFCGVTGYADDLLLLAPSRSAMETMLRICEDYADENNLEFSTDPDPAKSKSKCIFLQGNMKQPKPVNLKLYGVDLPWVKTATHLGHELSEDCNMEQDMKCKRGEFIDKSTTVRETFSFAQPNQILEAVRTYCCSLYGAMTWSLYTDKARQVFNTWSTCVKLAWGVPRATHNYLVDNLLSAGIPSLRLSILARFCKFFESVKTSNSMEVRLVASLASVGIRTDTGSNLFGIRKEFNLDPKDNHLWLLRSTILGSTSAVPEQDTWRIRCMKNYLEQKYQLDARHEDTSEITGLIDSLCSS